MYQATGLDWDYIQNRNDSDYLVKYRDSKEQEIMDKIYLSSSSGGISKKDLAKEVRLDEKNLWRYLTRLKSRGLIRKGDGLRGRLLPPEPDEKSYRDPLTMAALLGDSFRRKMLLSDKFLVCSEDRIEIPFSYCKDFTIYKKYFEPKFREADQLEQMIFEFSNRIGSYITYALMWAMDPENNGVSNSEHKDEMAKKLFMNAVSRVLPALMSRFRDTVYKGINQYPSGFQAKVDYMKESPRYVLSKNITDQVKRSIQRLYPRIFYELRLVTERLPINQEAERRFEEELKKEEYLRKRCLHEFGPPIELSSGAYLKKCVNCGYQRLLNRRQIQIEQRARAKKDEK